MKESTLNEVEDINFVICDLQYSSILHVPFYTRLLHHFFAYFGKINASITAPAFLGYIYYILIIVQSFLPAFLIDNEDLWPRESLMTMILYVLGYVFQGPQASIRSARVLISLIISILFIILFIILIIRTQHFHKTGRVTSIEIKFIYFTFKYIMPLFCPHLMAGLPISFDQIINQNKIDYNVLQIILSIASFVFYLYLLHIVVSPRVLLEDTPSHDWIPLLSVCAITNTTLLSVVSGISGCVEGKSRAGCSIWMLIQSTLLGFSFFYTNGIIKMIIGIVSSASSCTCAFASLLLTIDIFMSKPLSPEILFIASCIVFVALIVLFKILKQMKATKVLLFLDTLYDSGDTTEGLFEANYNKPLPFLCDIRLVIDVWIQFTGNFELFEMAVSKWPDNFDILLLYSRLLAIFPNKNQQMMAIATKITNLPEKVTRTSYLYQFRHLARTRQTSLTPSFRDKLDQINSKTVIIMDRLKRFWENILQKNTINFWADSDHVFSQIDDLDSLYAQLLDDYPNNYQLLNSYQNFVTNIKHNYNEAHEMTKKLETLKKTGSVKSNFGVEIALQVFPLLNNCIQLADNDQTQITENTTTTTNTTSIDLDTDNSKPDEDNNDEMNELKSNQNESTPDSNNQLESALTDLIDHSKLGTIWITCIIIVVMTIVVIVLFYIFKNHFFLNFIDKQRASVNFMLQVDLFCHELNFFCVNVNMLPIVYEDEDAISPISITNRTVYTESVAPVLFEQDKVPEFSLNNDELIDLLSRIKDRFTKVVKALSELNQDNEYVQEIHNLFYQDRKYGSTLNEITNNILTIAFELLKTETVREFYTKDNLYSNIKSNFLVIYSIFQTISSITNEYGSSSYDSSYEKLNEIMILVVLVSLLLMTLPYLIQLFLLIIQSESIAESFNLLPNTEIRSIISSFGKSTSKVEEDTTQVASLNSIRKTSKFSGTTTVLTFLASFLAVLICALVIYFSAKQFMDDTSSISNEIYTLTPSFASLSLAFTQAFRFYMLTHDGNSFHISNLEDNLYYSKGDNLSELMDSAFLMLNNSYKQFLTGLWSENGAMNCIYKDNKKSFDYFEDSFPSEYEQISPTKTFFEELATADFPEALDHIQDFIWFYLTEMKSYLDLYLEGNDFYLMFFGNEVPKMPSLIYWFSNFSEINRTEIYFSMIQDDVFEKIEKYQTIPNACFYFIIVWQLLACLLMILFLLNRHTKIKKSLQLYQFVKPEIVLQNQKVLSLIETGRQISEDNDTTYSNTDFIISKISQGVVITEKNLVISNYNDSFIKRCQLNVSNINGTLLTELFEQDDQDKSWQNFIQHVEDATSGKFKTQFKEEVSVKLKNGQMCHFCCNVTCLTALGVSNGSDFDHIQKIAFIFDDNTEMYMREQLIIQEKKHLDEMLSNVMPTRIVHSFVNTGECISFIVQSVSIGMVRVKTYKKFDKNSPEQFIFYREIFDRFDAEIKQFDLLTKINTFSHTYSYVGGLFSEINKPERHAEEAIKFGLRLLSIVPELSEKYGAEIHLTLGVHTGGPIIAGVLSFDKPTFQIIGTVNEMANQVKNKGVPDQICITRAVYELIFSASFKVQEQGDTTIRGGKVIPTYLVKL